jgi:hypothetical protein
MIGQSSKYSDMIGQSSVIKLRRAEIRALRTHDAVGAARARVDWSKRGARASQRIERRARWVPKEGASRLADASNIHPKK